jgi:uncharacterized membrane protein (Fun14 family)
MAIGSFLFIFAGGGALGFAAGFAIKRIIKIALIILGAFVLAMTYLSYKGIIQVNWDRAQHLTTSAAYTASEQVMNAINSTAIQLSAHPSGGTAYHFRCWLYRWLSFGVKTLRMTTSDNLEDIRDDLENGRQRIII